MGSFSLTFMSCLLKYQSFTSPWTEHCATRCCKWPLTVMFSLCTSVSCSVKLHQRKKWILTDHRLALTPQKQPRRWWNHSIILHEATFTICSCGDGGLSKHVIYEDVCTVGGFSAKWRPFTEPRADVKDMHERLLFKECASFLWSIFVLKETNYSESVSQSNVIRWNLYSGLSSRRVFQHLFCSCSSYCLFVNTCICISLALAPL